MVERGGGPMIMGILNVTPDSFSDGGRYVDLDAAVARAAQMVAEGAAFIDVGGESTRPGAAPVTIDAELQRVVPVVEAIVAEVALGAARVSVDTRRAEVARAAVAAGATLINDVSASLGPVAAELGVGWMAMHMQGQPGTMQAHPTYADVVAEVRDFLMDRATVAAEAGVAEIWIDPGFGFGKSIEHNLALVAHIDRFIETGYGVALGVSRKHTLGVLTARSDAARVGGASGAEIRGNAVAPPQDRLEMSVAVATWAMMAGVQVIRAHDVGVHVEAAAVVAGQR